MASVNMLYWYKSTSTGVKYIQAGNTVAFRALRLWNNAPVGEAVKYFISS